MNGKWQKSNSEEFIKSYSPIDGKYLGALSALTKEEVDGVFKAAKAAEKQWAEVELSEKSYILNRAADLLLENKEELTELLIEEIGKDKKSSLSEVERTADFIRFTADAGKNLAGETLRGDSFPGGSKNKINIVTRVPIGLVLAISPFNYPVNLSVSKIAPALMGGNVVVLKPPTQGAISALYVCEIFNKAGVPKGVLGTITGKGSHIGNYAVTHPLVDFINFTGSTEVGENISQITAMKPTLMELGGKDAAIVLEDADLNLAASNIVAGAFSYSGQRCTAVKRVLVIDKVADELVSIIRRKVEELKYGDPREDGVIVVPLISSKACDYVMELIKDAREKGAKILVGGERRKNLILPTLIDDVKEDMRVAWEEPFGPVLPIIRVKNLEEAIEISNKSLYGLQGAIFTKDINKAFYLADKLEVGTVQVNNKTERGPDNFPFSGVKASGIGTQGVRYSIEMMTRLKAIVLNLED